MALFEKTKSARARVLLTTLDYSAEEIAQIVKCDVSLVRRCRRRLHQPHPRQTIEARLSMLSEEIRELRVQVAELEDRVRSLESQAAPSRCLAPAGNRSAGPPR